MSKKSCYRGPIDKQHGKHTQTLLKTAPEYLYHPYWLLQRQLSPKNSLLLTCQILGLLVNTFPADGKYPGLNRQNLTIPIQMQLSQKQKTFSEFFAAFWKCRLNFEHCEKKYGPHRFCISEITDSENVVISMSKKSRFSRQFRKQHGNGPKHCWNVCHSTLIKIIDHCQGNWVRQSLSYWHAKSWDCLSTHWVSMTGILFLIEKI